MAKAKRNPSPTAQAETDPIFAAIATWRQATARHHREFNKNGFDGEAEKTCEAYHATALRMARIVPTTSAGASALLDYTLKSLRAGEADWHIPAVNSVAKFLRAQAREGV